MVGDVKNKIVIPVFGIIFITAVVVVAIQHFSGLDFGTLGLICWVVVLVGAFGFVIYVIGCLAGWW